jgi:hypothetical protein
VAAPAAPAAGARPEIKFALNAWPCNKIARPSPFKMKATTHSASGLPNMGEILGFIVDCLGVPKEKDSYTHKELQRLKKGGLSPQKYWAIAHKIIVSILASFTDDDAANQTIKKMLLQKLASRQKRDWMQMPNGLWLPVTELEPLPDALHWKFNDQGEVINFQERFVLDWLELLERNEFLLAHAPAQKRSPELLTLWASIFVLPFVAYNLIEYLEVQSNLESGMPGGTFWYLPEVRIAEDRKSYIVTQWPVNKVLEWWEDLLGEKFQANPGLLFPSGHDTDEARRQVHFWRHEGRTPDQETIRRWCKQSWDGKYRGIFVDDPALPLHERWNRCRAYLVGKGLNQSMGNWVDELPENIRAGYRQQKYRGEALELQILRFRECSFADFLESSDPIVQGLPVAELITRVAKRYAQPTNEQVKSRLLFAATFQRAFLAIEKKRGINFAAAIFGTYKEIYDYLMQLHLVGGDGPSALQFLNATPQPQLKLRYACEWLFDKRCWFELPSLLAPKPATK